jgi:hypothetical protein
MGGRDLVRPSATSCRVDMTDLPFSNKIPRFSPNREPSKEPAQGPHVEAAMSCSCPPDAMAVSAPLLSTDRVEFSGNRFYLHNHNEGHSAAIRGPTKVECLANAQKD